MPPRPDPPARLGRATGAALAAALLAAALLAAPGAAGAQATVRTPEVTASLVAAGDWLRPGAALPVAIRLQVAPGWYVYWRQPGEAGLPTTVEWRLPAGFRAAPLAFPIPRREESAGLVTHALRGDVVLLGAVTAPARARGRRTLRATVRYGVCREVCIPQTATLVLTLPLRDRAPEPDEAWRSLASAAAARAERPPTGLTLTARRDAAGRLCLLAAGPAAALAPLRGDSLLFFPSTVEPFPAALSLPARATTGGVAVRFPPGPRAARLQGVLAGAAGGGVVVDVAVGGGDCPAVGAGAGGMGG